MASSACGKKSLRGQRDTHDKMPDIAEGMIRGGSFAAAGSTEPAEGEMDGTKFLRVLFLRLLRLLAAMNAGHEKHGRHKRALGRICRRALFFAAFAV